MGFDKLSVEQRKLLLEVARMSYGSREGAAGGRGHIGLMKTKEGRTYILKFDTHGEKPTDDAEKKAATDSSKNLRSTLMRIAYAAELRPEVLADIRQKLGVEKIENKDYVPETGLLDRTISAKVVELIGGRRIWGEANYDKATYKSGKDTSFATVSKTLGDSANVREVGSVKINYDKERDMAVDAIWNFVNVAVYHLRSESKGQVFKLMERVLSKQSVDSAWDKCLSANDLRAAALKCLFRIMMVTGGVNAKDLPEERHLAKHLQRCAESTGGILGQSWWKDLAQDAEAMKWCADNGKRPAADVEDGQDENPLLTETLKRAFAEDIRRGLEGSKKVMCEFRRGDQTIRMKDVGASMSAALKGALGVKDNTPSVALEELEAFANFAREHQNAGDFYMKFAANGKTLTSAGSRNILRGSGSVAENNDVRQRLMECVTDLYDGKIPPSVKQVMTGFDGKGHPLSAKRVALIKDAIDLERGVTALVKEFGCTVPVDAFVRCGLTAENVRWSLDQLSAQHNLTDDEKRIVGRMTFAYLASQAEEVSDKFSLPKVDTLMRQIAGGTCNGTHLALQHLQKISHDNGGVLAGDSIDSFVNDTVRLMNVDDVEALAYFAGKFQKINPRENGGKSSSGTSLIFLKDMVERKGKLLYFRAQHGKMTLGDLWQQRFGTKMPKGARVDQQNRFVKKHFLRWIDEFETRHPGFKAHHKIDDDRSKSADDNREILQSTIENKIGELGIPLEQAGLLSFDEEVDRLDISSKSMVYDTRSEMYTGTYKTKAGLITQLVADFKRAAGEFLVGDERININPEATNEEIRQKVDDLYNAIAKMLKYDENNPVPEDDVPNQLKTALIVCTQAGNTILTLIGLDSKADHYPTQKTFSLQKDGQVLYTIAATFGDRQMRVSYDIAQDGTSSCLGATVQRVHAQPVEVDQDN